MLAEDAELLCFLIRAFYHRPGIRGSGDSVVNNGAILIRARRGRDVRTLFNDTVGRAYFDPDFQGDHRSH